MDYTTLIADKATAGSIKNWAADGSIPSVDVLTEAQAWIYQTLRVRQMIATQTGTMTTTAANVALPEAYLDPIQMRIIGTAAGKVSIKTLPEVLQSRAYDASGAMSSSKPTKAAPDATNLQFECIPDSAYPYELTHYAIPAALSTATTTNFVTSRAPRLLKAACLGIAEEYKKNAKERDRWLNIAIAEIDAMNAASDLALSGSEIDVEVL